MIPYSRIFCLYFLLLFFQTSFATGKIKVYFTQPVNASVATGPHAIYVDKALDDTLVAYINRAKYTLDVAVYNCSQSYYFSAISTAINNAYARGVNIRWIYDGSAANWVLNYLNNGINTLGRPVSTTYGIMHHKFMIIDANSPDTNDAIVWTGSANWHESDFSTDYNNVVIVQHLGLALAYTAQFNQMWGSAGLVPDTNNSKFGADKSDNTQHIFFVDGIKVECYFTPSDSTNKHILDFVSASDSQLFFSMYTFTHLTDADSIVARKNAGVYTAGILDQYSLSFGAYSILNAGLGNMLRVYTDSDIYHNKFAIADLCNPTSDPQVITGSHNWTFGADINNDENTLIIHDATIANMYYQSFSQNFFELGGTVACTITSTGDLDHDKEIVVYPNPSFSEKIFLNVNTNWQGGLYQLYDISSNLISEAPVTGTTIELPSPLPAGVYVLKVFIGEKNITKQVISLSDLK